MAAADAATRARERSAISHVTEDVPSFQKGSHTYSFFSSRSGATARGARVSAATRVLVTLYTHSRALLTRWLRASASLNATSEPQSACGGQKKRVEGATSQSESAPLAE